MHPCTAKRPKDFLRAQFVVKLPSDKDDRQTASKVMPCLAESNRAGFDSPTPHFMTPLVCREINKGDGLRLN